MPLLMHCKVNAADLNVSPAFTKKLRHNLRFFFFLNFYLYLNWYNFKEWIGGLICIMHDLGLFLYIAVAAGVGWICTGQMCQLAQF